MNHHSLNPPPGESNLFWRNSKRSLLKLYLTALVVLLMIPAMQAQISFDFSTLNFQGQGNISAGTSLQFGPDGKLYVSERYGNIKVLTIQRNGTSDYQVISSQTISLVKNAPNHNDDGSNAGNNNRQVTGLTVTGTASNPVIYVSSSDPRIGGGGSGGDANLDTNSGIITRLTKNGNSWSAVDIVRGLPRSEENHATNGMEFTTIGGTDYLIVCSGGFTNAGSPSNNFAHISEYALSGAILSVNLTQLESMPILSDNGRSYIYDLPTLDDPTRPNQNGITDPDTQGYNGKDQGDPFGGNDGLNMAMLVPGGPVQMFSPGYRNAYDLVLTASGAVYVTDNGANGGWGGFPENEGTPNVNNNYRGGEPGSNNNDGNEGKVNNKDHLQMVTTNINNYNFGSYYGGHPTPVRANTNAGLYTKGNHTSGGQYFRTVPYDPSSGGEAGDPNKALPANWPPVPASLINVDNADFRNPGDNNPDGQNDNPITTWNNNTNGIDEYTASNFGGAMQGNLIAGKSGGSLHRVVLQGNGQLAQLEQNKFSTQGGNPLGITCQGDNDVFPGTIWVATFDSRIVVLEPADAVACIQPGQSGYDPNADYDSDGFSNQDEIDNGTDHCSGASQPNDFDNDSVSDLNDLDDDGDGINDQNDPFQLGQAFDFPVINELFSDNQTLGGYLGLGLTGLMNNGDPNPNYLDWMDDPNDPNSPVNDIYGGAIGAVTIYQTAGDAFSNNQEKAFQYGVNVDQGTGNFVVKSLMLPPFHNHVGNESQGIFLGTGFQDNYIKLVINSGGIAVQGENNGSQINGLPSGSIPNPSSEVILILAVDPAAGTVQAKYSINGSAVQDLGAPFAVNGAVKNAIQQSNTPLAVGLIGTNGGNGEFAANWDYLNVEADSDNPYITQQIPDISRGLSAQSENIDLNQHFDDNGGHGNLTYSVQQNSNPAIGANVNGNNLTLTYPANPASSNITVRATDQGGLFVEQTFTVNVVDQPTGLLYRVNAGGASISAIDGGIDWGEDTGGNNSPYLADPGTNTTNGFAMQGYDASVDQTTTPTSIFATERWDNAGGSEMKYSFPIQQPGDYEVRLYVGNGFGGTQVPGSRIYSVSVEGSVPSVYQDIDLSDTFGHLIGGMISYIVTVNDGSLDIEFLHNVENPLINGIEIIGGNGGGNNSTPIVLNGISNQSNTEGDNVNLGVQASGGDGNLVYSASGLPPGLSINTGTGVISGTIAANAANNSPFTVTVNVDDSDADNTDIQTTTFTWTVTSPGQVPIVLSPVQNQSNQEGDNANVTITASGGDGNLVYSATNLPPGAVIDPTNGLIGGTIQAGASNNSPYTVSISVDDSDGDNTDIQNTSFVWTILPPGQLSGVLYRINAGGAGVTSIDAEMDWEEDSKNNNSPYLVEAGSNHTSNQGVNSLDASVNANTTPASIFDTERSDFGGGEEVQYSFPVSQAGDYEIRLYMGNGYGGTASPGTRIFAVSVEGSVPNVYQSIDLSDFFGHKVGGMISYIVNVTDGAIDLEFLHEVENPLVNGIEILGSNGGGNNSTPIVLSPFSNQNNNEGDNVNLAVQASGGDGALQYSANGLPPGLGINANTGQITGTIAAGASNNSPYQVSVSVDDSDADNTDIQTTSFSWVVNTPGPGPGSDVLYRINAGGPAIAAIDADIDWAEDSKNNNSQYLVAAGSNHTSNQGVNSLHSSVNQNTTPFSIYDSERSDFNGGDEIKYSFPVSQAGSYEVRLYMGNGYGGTTNPGTRVYSVKVEGSIPGVYQNIDLSATYGHKVGAMLSYIVNVNDGALDLEFIHNIENPLVNGIEIVGASGTNPGNQVPVALMSATPTSGTAPLLVSFDGSASFDPDNDPLTYSWNYGDGSQGNGATSSHTYTTAGSYTATLTVNDGNGGIAQSSEVITVTTGTNPCNNGTVTYISDLNWTSAINQGHAPNLDKSHDNKTLTINGKTYAKGIGAHADSEITYNLNGAYERFLSDIGMDDETCNTASSIFRVMADGNMIYESPLLRQSDNAVSIDLDVTGVNQLVLIVDRAVSNFWCDHADWGDARLEANCNGNRDGDESTFAPAFSLYPNPTQTGKFLIEADLDVLNGPIEVEIWSMNGQLVKTERFDSPVMKMEIGSNRPNGVYLVKVKYNDHWNTYRILKMP